MKKQCDYCEKQMYYRCKTRPKKFCSELCRHKYKLKNRLDADYPEEK